MPMPGRSATKVGPCFAHRPGQNPPDFRPIACSLSHSPTVPQWRDLRAPRGTKRDLTSWAQRACREPLDAEPTLVATGSIRDYNSPEAAVAGPYARRVQVREPLVLLACAHPSEEVRRLALNAQARLELDTPANRGCDQGGPRPLRGMSVKRLRQPKLGHPSGPALRPP